MWSKKLSEVIYLWKRLILKLKCGVTWQMQAVVYCENSNMDDEEDFETLGERLYSRIYPKHKETAGKLTGEVTCVVTLWIFLLNSYIVKTSKMCIVVTLIIPHKIKVPKRASVFRYVTGAARSCRVSDAAGRGHAECSCRESPQSPAVKRAQVQQWVCQTWSPHPITLKRMVVVENMWVLVSPHFWARNRGVGWSIILGTKKS